MLHRFRLGWGLPAKSSFFVNEKEIFRFRGELELIPYTLFSFHLPAVSHGANSTAAQDMLRKVGNLIRGGRLPLPTASTAGRDGGGPAPETSPPHRPAGPAEAYTQAGSRATQTQSMPVQGGCTLLVLTVALFQF